MIEVEMLIENKDGYKRWFKRNMPESRYKDFLSRVGETDPKGYRLVQIIKVEVEE